MVHSLLPVPFAMAAQQRQYEAVLAALQAEAAAPATVLLGNLAAFAPLAADALVVWPGGWALLALVPHAGHLTVPAWADGAWQLDGHPLPGYLGAANPFTHYCQQQPAALAWLSEQLGALGAGLPPGAGLAVFEAPLTFGAEVEAYLNRYAAAHDFELVAGAAQLPPRLQQLAAASGTAQLPESALVAWASQLAALAPAGEDLVEADPAEEELSLAAEEPGEPSAADYLGQKLRQLWRWLGAEDIPADPPYGAAPAPPAPAPDPLAAARLQQLRHELQHELAQQRHEAAGREAALLHELAQLRQQITQAGQSATARQAELATKAALEESLRATRAELAARNQELDARIRQLGQLIEQRRTPSLAAEPTPVAAALPAAPARLASRAASPKPAYRRLYQVERWGLIALAAGILGAGGLGLARWLHPPKSRPLASTRPRPARQEQLAAEAQAPPPVIIYDSAARTPLLLADTTLVRGASATEPEPPRPAEPAAHPDSAAAPREAAPTPTDSTTASPTP